MAQQSTLGLSRKAVLSIGAGLVLIALVLLVVFGVYLASRGNIFGGGVVADAVVFIDAPGRIGIDGTLQVEGPAPIPVSAGEHSLVMFDSKRLEPLNVSVKTGDFTYVPNPDSSRSHFASSSYGVVHVSAFPPNTTIEIPNCTPTDAKYPSTCKSSHTLNAELSPGSYAIKYSNPQFGEYVENITVIAGSLLRREYSFISTVAEWDAWKDQHGDIVERQYPHYYRRSRAGSAILLPFEAVGELLDGVLY